MKTIEVNGVTLAYEEYGSGEDYLISTQNFFFSGSHMELLGKEPYHYHTFLIYMRGYDCSTHIEDPAPRDYTTVWGKDVLAFADAIGIDRFYYTGVSHGNWAGWYIAFHRPERLRGFACVDGIAQFRTGPVSIPRQQADAAEWTGKREMLEKIAWAENWPTENPDRLAKRAQNHSEHLAILLNRKKEEFTVRNTNMTCCEAETEAEFYQRMAGIPVPVFLLNGALDPLAKVEDVLKLAKVIPGAQMKIYQHYGHGAADECPEVFARDCDRFFHDTYGQIL